MIFLPAEPKSVDIVEMVVTAGKWINVGKWLKKTPSPIRLER
jgi:hypothetical protein